MKMKLPLMPAFQGSVHEGTQDWASQPTPQSELWVCPKCGQAVWHVPRTGHRPVCSSTPACRATKKKNGSTRMVPATKAQLAQAKKHDAKLREEFGRSKVQKTV